MKIKAILSLSSHTGNQFSPSLLSITPNAIGKSDVAENQRRQNLLDPKHNLKLFFYFNYLLNSLKINRYLISEILGRIGSFTTC